MYPYAPSTPLVAEVTWSEAYDILSVSTRGSAYPNMSEEIVPLFPDSGSTYLRGVMVPHSHSEL